MTLRLKQEFAEHMRNLLVKEREMGLNSARFRQMIDEFGAVEAAQRLLAPDRQLPPMLDGVGIAAGLLKNAARPWFCSLPPFLPVTDFRLRHVRSKIKI